MTNAILAALASAPSLRANEINKATGYAPGFAAALAALLADGSVKMIEGKDEYGYDYCAYCLG